MAFHDGFEVLEDTNQIPIIPTGDDTLDELLGGGFRKDILYLLYGDKRLITDILLKSSVISQKINKEQNLSPKWKVIYVDSNNRFNPYKISKLAVSYNLSPNEVLKNIIISRAFTWDQMVELLENQLPKLESMHMVIVSGITTLFLDYEQRTFEGLHNAIMGIKTIIEKFNPIVILTAPLHGFSVFWPKGGKILSHFAHALVMIKDEKRFVEYSLVQHPYLPENKLIKWKPLKPKRGLKKPMKNAVLDEWF